MILGIGFRFSDHRSLRLRSLRSSGASSERAIETESEPKEKRGAPDRPPKSTIAPPPLRSHLPSLSIALFQPLAFSLFLSLSLSLSLSLPPFDPSTALLCLFCLYPSPDLSIRLSSPPVLPLYLTPTSHSQLVLGEHEYAPPRSCR